MVASSAVARLPRRPGHFRPRRGTIVAPSRNRWPSPSERGIEIIRLRAACAHSSGVVDGGGSGSSGTPTHLYRLTNCSWLKRNGKPLFLIDVASKTPE